MSFMIICHSVLLSVKNPTRRAVLIGCSHGEIMELWALKTHSTLNIGLWNGWIQILILESGEPPAKDRQRTRLLKRLLLGSSPKELSVQLLRWWWLTKYPTLKGWCVMPMIGAMALQERVSRIQIHWDIRKRYFYFSVHFLYHLWTNDFLVWFIQVLSMCPYYFVLEEKFTSRAGIRAAATSDRLFGHVAHDHLESSDEDYCYNWEMESEVEGELSDNNSVVDWTSEKPQAVAKKTKRKNGNNFSCKQSTPKRSKTHSMRQMDSMQCWWPLHKKRRLRLKQTLNINKSMGRWTIL